MQRLQKILSARGVCSRRQAEEMIEAGRVAVDGVVATLGTKADPQSQEICVDGVPIAKDLAGRVYYMLHKPKGYITTVSDDRGRKTVMDLLGKAGEGLWPVGRLDYLSEGLLLLTNDGELTQKLTHPSYEVEKTYEVFVRGDCGPEKMQEMQLPLVIEGEAYKAAKVRLIAQEGKGKFLLEVKISEGKNRQVRKLCAHFGLEVLRLVRRGEGKLLLGDLPPGSYRPLSQQERDDFAQM